MHAHSAKRADDQKHADPVTGTPAIHDYTPKELRKLSRSELLEVMIAQADQIERLQAELAQVRDELAQKSIAIDEAGSIAEAALRLNGVFEAAQKAADEYVAAVAKKCAGGALHGRFYEYLRGRACHRAWC